MIVYYLFAFYIFLLVCGVIWFYGRVMRTEKKKDHNSYEKEHRLFVMYQNVEDMLDSFEAYTEEVKSDIDKRLGQVESLIESFRKDWEDQIEPTLREVEARATSAQKELPEEAAPPAPISRREKDTQPEPDHTGQEILRESVPEHTRRRDMERPQKNDADKPKPKTPELIQQYAEQGMNKEEIAKALGISMREVSLIMEIKKIQV